MKRAFVGIGSNLGDRLAFCRQALKALRATPGVWLRRWSPVYLSPPWGFSSPHWFFNLVAEIETVLSPWNLLFWFWRIEASAGRIRKGKVSDRPLDLDLLLYEHTVFSSSVLTLPHPRMHERAFVLRPLCDLYALGRHPLFKKSFQELSSRLKQEVYFLTFIDIEP